MPKRVNLLGVETDEWGEKYLRDAWLIPLGSMLNVFANRSDKTPEEIIEIVREKFIPESKKMIEDRWYEMNDMMNAKNDRTNDNLPIE